jgi:hypothetical protein
LANQNGKLLDRITTDYATNTFVLDPPLDLANGVTPNGVPREFAGRPDNAPIIVVPDGTSTLAFVTLRGGGLFVVDPTTTPMEILAEYDNTAVHANGLQEGIRKTFKDPDFRAEFKKVITDDASPLMPEELTKIIHEMPRDPEVIDMLKKMSGPEPLPSRQ